MDEDRELFRELAGNKEKRVPTEEEVEEARERLSTKEGTMGDLFTALPDIIEERQNHYLDLYGLKRPFTEEEDSHSKAMFELMSDEQYKLYHRAMNTYSKRNFPPADLKNKTNSLAQFAATNPPEVLRRHIWRLQRGLDEPLFGKEMPPPLTRIKEYQATIEVQLCTNCAEELIEETKESGAEEGSHRSKSNPEAFRFYDRHRGYYMFRYENMYVQRDRGGFLDWPSGPPLVCDRCGVNDVDLWREQIGEAD